MNADSCCSKHTLTYPTPPCQPVCLPTCVWCAGITMPWALLYYTYTDPYSVCVCCVTRFARACVWVISPGWIYSLDGLGSGKWGFMAWDRRSPLKCVACYPGLAAPAVLIPTIGMTELAVIRSNPTAAAFSRCSFPACFPIRSWHNTLFWYEAPLTPLFISIDYSSQIWGWLRTDRWRYKATHLIIVPFPRNAEMKDEAIASKKGYLFPPGSRHRSIPSVI